MRLLSVTLAVFLVILALGRGLYWVVSQGAGAAEGRIASTHTPHTDDSQSHNLFRIDGRRSSAKAVAFAPTDSMRTKGEPKSTKNHEIGDDKGVASSPRKNEKAPLKFRKVRVMGRMASPRLDFTQESLPVERVDEPMRQEFFQKVFEPVGDYSF